MPKFALTLKALIGNKENLSEMARTPLNEHRYVVLLKKLPKKLGDPCKFLIPCDFPGMAECLALADLGASINLMPFSVWKILSLPNLTPMCTNLELSDCLIYLSVGVAEDVYVKVGSFHFSADFVVVDFDADPRVSLILGRSFLKIGRTLFDVFKEVLGFFDTILSGNPTPFYDLIVSTTSSTLTPFGNSDFLLEEVDAFLAIEDEPTSSEFYQPYLDPEGDILLLEAFLNDDLSLPPPNQRNYMPEVRKELKIYEAKSDKSLVDEPQTVKLKDLPPHLEYAFLEGDDKLLVIIAKDLSVEEKTALITVLKSHKRAIAWKLSDIKGINPEFYTHKILIEEDFEPAVQHQRRVNPKSTMLSNKRTFAYRCMPFGLCNAPGTFQRCMMAIFHDMIEKTMKVFMDDFSVLGNSFQICLSHLKRMLKRYEDTNLCLNWEKSHFMVKERIILGHKISKQGIEVDKAKVDVITKLPHPTTVKDVRSFLGHAGFYRRFIKDFSKIARPMTRLLEKDTPFIFSQECVEAFQTLKRKLTKAPILIASDWYMPFELMCDASDFDIGTVLGQRQDKHFRPIHYASKTMTKAESNYTTNEKEMLAVVYAFEKKRDQMDSVKTFLRNFNRISFYELPKVLSLAWETILEIELAFDNRYCQPEDDDEDYAIAITPSSSTEEPDNSLSMGDEHLDTVLATKSDEFIKSTVESLIPIPSESEGVPNNMRDVPFHDNSLPLDVSKDQFEDFFDSNDEYTLTDDDSFSIDNIEYVEVSPPDSELISSEVMEIVIPKVGGIDDDILLTIKDDILREKLLNINLLIAIIEALNDNPTPSSDFTTNSGSTTTRSDISLPEYEVFYDNHVKEISSGSTTTHSDSSLYDSFIFDLLINPFPPADRSNFYEFANELSYIISPPEYDYLCFKIEPNSGDFTMDVVEDISPTREPRVYIALPTHPNLQLNLDFILSSESLFAYVVWIFLHFLSYSVAP
nr:reverse transcriptase domain-containing protein [Tanacetum cinerariifolium]